MKLVSHLLVLLLKGLILVWQWVLSPVLGANCRYQPSCSHYAAEALSRHGAVRGSWLAARRIFSCNPWGGAGYDPVPAAHECAEPDHTRHDHHISRGAAMPTPRS
ncbi:MAG: membrane protein insertion efficiency factor YidD [Proteobacteria bacterium]|nr:membrane protein insertion efficiency factor YidD [Pseudomonadota bacterium]